MRGNSCSCTAVWFGRALDARVRVIGAATTIRRSLGLDVVVANLPRRILVTGVGLIGPGVFGGLQIHCAGELPWLEVSV